jgi:ATP-dependent DNA helicase RecQ
LRTAFLKPTLDRDGFQAKRKRRPKTFSAPDRNAPPRLPLAELEAPVDAALMDYLREWRRNLAKTQKVSAFVVMHDVSLEDLCRKLPANLRELEQVVGFGERKIATYGESVLEALHSYRNGARSEPRSEPAQSAAEETKQLLAQGCSLEEIAAKRGRPLITAVSAIAVMIEAGETEFQEQWSSPERRARIEQTVEELGMNWLKPILAALPDISFPEIRLVLAEIRRQAGWNQPASRVS